MSRKCSIIIRNGTKQNKVQIRICMFYSRAPDSSLALITVEALSFWRGLSHWGSQGRCSVLLLFQPGNPVQGLYTDASRIICLQNECTDLSEEGEAPFIPLYSSASEFLRAQKWGTLWMYLIYLITLYVPDHVLHLKHGMARNLEVSLSIFRNLVMKEVGINSVTWICVKKREIRELFPIGWTTNGHRTT